MPDQRMHRGPNPDDLRDFAPDQLPRLAEAQADLSWLLSRGYAHRSGIKLVGDRHALTARQRMAVLQWRVELVQNPDAVLAGSEQLVVSADSAILDECARWVNLGREVVFGQAPDAWVVHLDG